MRFYSLSAQSCFEMDIPTTWNKNYGPYDVVDEINAKRKDCGSPLLEYSAPLSGSCKAYLEVIIKNIIIL